MARVEITVTVDGETVFTWGGPEDPILVKHDPGILRWVRAHLLDGAGYLLPFITRAPRIPSTAPHPGGR
jgi:hypothetical protein